MADKNLNQQFQGEAEAHAINVTDKLIERGFVDEHSRKPAYRAVREVLSGEKEKEATVKVNVPLPKRRL